MPVRFVMNRTGLKRIAFTILLPFIAQACDKYETGEYTPLPKIHLGETFRYLCVPENYIQMAYDSLGSAAVLNFYKEEVTDLDYIDYDEQSCTFSFNKGETMTYRISWDYESEKNVVRFLYGQNGMWYRMNSNYANEYILEANDGMAIRTVVYRTNYDSINITVNQFRIEEYTKNRSLQSNKDTSLFLDASIFLYAPGETPQHRLKIAESRLVGEIEKLRHILNRLSGSSRQPLASSSSSSSISWLAFFP